MYIWRVVGFLFCFVFLLDWLFLMFESLKEVSSKTHNLHGHARPGSVMKADSHAVFFCLFVFVCFLILNGCTFLICICFVAVTPNERPCL